jgi:branched-chain amino acid transport system permease protein
VHFSRLSRSRSGSKKWVLPTLVALLLAFLATFIPVGATASAAVPICSPDATTACVRGTLLDDDSNAVAKVSVTLTPPTGPEETEVTGSTGQWVFSVHEKGQYKVSVDTSTLPKGLKLAVASKTLTVALSSLAPAAFDITGSQTSDGHVVQQSATSLYLLRVWQQFASGLRLGLLIALASIGLSLVYGTTGLSNFAHAEQVTLGGMLGFTFAGVLGLNLIVASVITVILCALTGYLQDKFIWGPLRKRGLGLNQLMIVTIGLSIALEYLYQYFYGGQPVAMTGIIQQNTGPLYMTPISYLSMAIAVVVLVAVGLFLLKTRIGRATRAVSDNRALAAASGIDVDRIIRLVWIISTGLAGLAGVLYSLVQGGMQWSTGLQLLLLMFAAVTLGGLGTAFGALVGSMIIGVVVEMSNLVLSADLKYATALVILILVLLVRPQGILGRRERIG